MNSKPLRISAGCIAATAVLLCWYWLRLQPDGAPRSAAKVPAPAARLAGTARSAEPWPEFHTAEFNARARDRAMAWLESEGRTAGSLLAVWDFIEDPFILQEAANRFPDNPAVCLALIASRTNDPQDCLYWAGKLTAAEPLNSQGPLIKVWALAAMGDPAGAMAALRGTAGRTSLFPTQNHLHDRALFLAEIANACGLPAREQSLLPLRLFAEEPLTRLTLNAIARLVDAEMSDPKEAAYPMEWYHLADESITRLKTNGPRTLDVALAARQLELAMLNHLPNDTALIDDLVTAGTKVQEIQAQWLDLAVLKEQALDVAAALPSASDAVVAEYASVFLTSGEAAAVEWFMKQRTTAEK